MPDPLAFLLETLAARNNPYASAKPLQAWDVAQVARKHGVSLPTWDDTECEEVEQETAEEVLTVLRTRLTDALTGEDATGGREVLNELLESWQTRIALEEDLGESELPGVEVTATTLPTVELPYWHARLADVPRDTAERCPHLTPILLAMASVLLTEATNIHLSGYADRVRPCEA
ncbi:MAG: hypothetical protein Q4F65_08000, partial [Propionibacteriaceae bacterium]|nr:hypothetical protein [Propionibacteriaceae bacterium]